MKMNHPGQFASAMFPPFVRLSVVTFTTSKTKNKFRGKERNREREREREGKRKRIPKLWFRLSLWIIGTPTNFQSHEVKKLKRTSR